MAVVSNAPPTGYNSSYTGPQIDAAVGAVLAKEDDWDEAAAAKLPPGGEEGQILTKSGAEDYDAEWTSPPFLVRPNLLANWYFVGNGAFPINQRGQTIYSNAGPCIDRWTLVSGSVQLTGAGLFLNGTISQAVEAPVAQPVTATVLTSAGLLAAAFDAETNVFSISGASLTVFSAKLELGDTQTHAHQKNGAWALNELPDFADELAKCQRYLFAIGGIFRERAAFVAPGLIQFSVPCPPQFALAPAAGGIAIEQLENLTIAAINSAQAQTGFSVSVLGRSTLNPTIVINAAKDSHGLSDAQICITTSTKKVLFSVS